MKPPKTPKVPRLRQEEKGGTDKMIENRKTERVWKEKRKAPSMTVKCGCLSMAWRCRRPGRPQGGPHDALLRTVPSIPLDTTEKHSWSFSHYLLNCTLQRNSPSCEWADGDKVNKTQACSEGAQVLSLSDQRDFREPWLSRRVQGESGWTDRSKPEISGAQAHPKARVLKVWSAEHLALVRKANHSRPAESKILGMQSSNLRFQKPSRGR